jgi:hypothetical protein
MHGRDQVELDDIRSLRERELSNRAMGVQRDHSHCLGAAAQQKGSMVFRIHRHSVIKAATLDWIGPDDFVPWTGRSQRLHLCCAD